MAKDDPGVTSDAGSGQTDRDETGLSAEEQAEFDSMRGGEPAPADPEPDKAATPEPAAAKEPTADMGDGEDDDGDDEPELNADGKPKADHSKPREFPRRVAYGKYERLAKKAKETEAKLREKDETLARLDERMKLINEAIATPADDQAERPDEDPEPDPDEDVIAHNKWLSRQRGRDQEELRTMREERQTQAAEVRMKEEFTEDAEKFRQTEPSFPFAYHYAMTARMKELQALAPVYGWKDGDIRRQLAQEERDIVTAARKSGASPSSVVFNYAVAKGFDKEKAIAEWNKRQGNGAAAASTNGANGAEAKPAAAPAAPNVPGAMSEAAAPGSTGSVSDEIARIKAGSEASRSLSDGGGSPGVALTAEQLAKMPEEEFAHLLETLPKERLRELLGN